MDLFNALGGGRSDNGGMSSIKMALIGVLAYDTLKTRGRLADSLGVGPPSGSLVRDVLQHNGTKRAPYRAARAARSLSQERAGA